MNADRRKRLQKARDLITEAWGIVEECATEERQALDNLPETLQAGERFDKMEEAASALEQLNEELQGHDTTLEEAMGEGA